MLPGSWRGIRTGAVHNGSIAAGQAKAELPTAIFVNVKKPSGPVGTAKPILVERRDWANPGGISRRQGIGFGPEFDAESGGIERGVKGDIHFGAAIADGYTWVVQSDGVADDA